MAETFKNSEQQEGWKDETEKYAVPLQTFLAEALRRKRMEEYNQMTELHFSGASPILENVQKGDALPSSVRVQYRGGQPIQIHAYYPCAIGQGLDVYVSGKALEDFLMKK